MDEAERFAALWDELDDSGKALVVEAVVGESDRPALTGQLADVLLAAMGRLSVKRGISCPVIVGAAWQGQRWDWWITSQFAAWVRKGRHG